MKKTIKCILMAVVVVMVCSVGIETSRVSAAGMKSICPEKAGKRKAIKADIDGDGIQNKISVHYTCDKYDFTKKIYVEIDGSSALVLDVSKYNAFGCHLNVVESNSRDKCIHLYSYTDNDYIVFSEIYKYNKQSKKLFKVLDLLSQGDNSTIVKATKNGFITKNRTQPSEIGWISWKFTYVWKNGKPVLKTNTVPPTSTIMRKFTTGKTLKFSREAGGKEAAFILKRGKKVSLINVKVTKKKMYVQFQYGKKKGWLCVGQEKYEKIYQFDKEGNLISSYFEGVHERLAG